ncbi:hypothetical protein DFH06DRAFT_1463923 [Mycena polygramma]|nr:hypothetical protein DFH06DRAFT_1463923 [Mycena polygramma]
MPPTLRSSPAGTRVTRNSAKIATPEKPQTPGKPRYCTSCKRPRKGHPREGCPFIEQSTQTETLSDSPTRSVADALDALNLAGLDADAATDNEGYEEKKPRKPFTRMPGTLLTPTSSFMYSQSSQVSCKDSPPPPDNSFSIMYPDSSQISDLNATAGGLRPRSHTSMDSRPLTPPPRPLTRTLTSEERTAFTASLTQLAKAAVYVLPTADVPAICATAATRGLSTRTLPLDHADTLLVVGHTAAAVEVLLYQVETKMHALVPPPDQTHVLSTTAKAMVVGAVGAAAAWSALAFS